MFSTHLQDVSATYDLREKFPGRVQLLRFEDLANDPYTVSTALVGIKSNLKVIQENGQMDTHLQVPLTVFFLNAAHK